MEMKKWNSLYKALDYCKSGFMAIHLRNSKGCLTSFTLLTRWRTSGNAVRVATTAYKRRLAYNVTVRTSATFILLLKPKALEYEAA